MLRVAIEGMEEVKKNNAIGLGCTLDDLGAWGG